MRSILLELPDAQVVPCTCKGIQEHRHHCPMLPASMHKSVAANFHREHQR